MGIANPFCRNLMVLSSVSVRMTSFFKGVTFAALLLAGGTVSAWAVDTDAAIAKGPPLSRIRGSHWSRCGRFGSSDTLLTDTQSKCLDRDHISKALSAAYCNNGIDRMETTALDDYEGWQKIEDLKDKGRWRMKLLTKDQVKRLRANTWENLAFFRGLQLKGGRWKIIGDTTDRGSRGAQTELHAHHRERVYPLL
jgi:hypothetical protein